MQILSTLVQFATTLIFIVIYNKTHKKTISSTKVVGVVVGVGVGIGVGVGAFVNFDAIAIPNLNYFKDNKVK